MDSRSKASPKHRAWAERVFQAMGHLLRIETCNVQYVPGRARGCQTGL
jgi:hypothetical protein